MSGDSEGIHLRFSRNGVFAVEVEFGPTTRTPVTVGPPTSFFGDGTNRRIPTGDGVTSAWSQATNGVG